MKRILLFVVTNLAVLLVLPSSRGCWDSTLTSPPTARVCRDCWYGPALFGFGGAFISLAMSKMQAKMFMGVQVIDPQPADPTQQWLLSVVEHHARNAGVGMPEVGIFNSPEPNAFATGASRNSALVAVSSGLLQRMNRQEIEAVLGHEMTHVANGDMVTLALIQGVVNTFVLLPRAARRQHRRPGGVSLRRWPGHRLVSDLLRPADRLRHPRHADRHVVLALA